MKFLFKIILIIVPFILTLLDVSFFSQFSIFGATILSLYSILLIYSFLGEFANFLILATSSIFLFSIFSSVPVWLIFISFFIIPSVIFYLRKNFFPDSSILFVSSIFLLSNFIFQFLLLAYSREWNNQGLLALAYFVFLNSFFGILIFLFAKKMLKKYKRNEVKF